MTSVHAHAVVQRCLSLLLLLVSGICEPSVALQEDSWAEIFLRVPPVGGTGGGAASAENAFIETIELLAVFLTLEIFLTVGRWGRVLEVGLDGFVLLVEMGEIRNDVLDDVGVGKRVDLSLLLGVGWNAACISHDQ